MNITSSFIPALISRVIPQVVSLGLLAFSIGASAQIYVQPNVALSGTSTGGLYFGSSTPSGFVGTGSSASSTYVQPHVTPSGSLVQGYHRTTPDSSTLNNYGTSGNFNPYTGAVGTRK